jgi:hypothetical protein
MISFDGTETALLASSVRGAVWLLEADFLTAGTQRMTSNPTDLTYGANTYTRAGAAMRVSKLAESEDAATSKMTFAFAMADSSRLSLAMGNPSEYRGRAIRLYLGLVNAENVAVGTPKLRWPGQMDHISIRRAQPKALQPEGMSVAGYIELRCSRVGSSRARRFDGLRVTHAQHKFTYPTDNSYEYVQLLVERPSVWLSKKFQEIE